MTSSTILNSQILLKSKYLFLLVIGLVLIGNAQSCKVDEDDKPIPNGDLRINIVHHVKGKELVLDVLEHTNAANNEYYVSQFQYYLSNFELTGGSCGDYTPEASYHLISEIDDPNLGGLYQKTTVDLSVESGCYKNLGFYIGVDEDRRANGPYTGDLSSIWNMAWDWSGDYIFMKLAGEFVGEDEMEESFVYHLAGEDQYKKVNLDLKTELKIEAGEQTEITIYADINKVFEGAHTIDFNNDASTMDPGSALAKKLGENYANMFSLAKD